MAAASAKPPIGDASAPAYGPPAYNPQEVPPPMDGPLASPVRKRGPLLIVGIFLLLILLFLLSRCW